MNKQKLGGFALVGATLGTVIAIAAGACDSDKHKVTCWKPAFAANPTTAPWAKNPSVHHRHGEGPKGSDICNVRKPK